MKREKRNGVRVDQRGLPQRQLSDQPAGGGADAEAMSGEAGGDDEPAVPGADGAFVAIGFSGHGFCLGPITGKILSGFVQGRPSELPLDPFVIGRPALRRNVSSPATLHG